MLVEMVARKPLAIGSFKLEPGDVVTSEIEGLLPPGRMKVLKDQGWLSERPVAQDTDGLVARLAVLEEKVAQLEARRSPGRPRKAAE